MTLVAVLLSALVIGVACRWMWHVGEARRQRHDPDWGDWPSDQRSL